MKKRYIPLAVWLLNTSAFAGIDESSSVSQVCGTDHNGQRWSSQLTPALTGHSTLAQKIKIDDNGEPGRYYIPVVMHVYGSRYNCDSGGKCLTDEKIQDALRKTNEDFLGLNTQDGPIAEEFQAIRENLNIEFVLARKDPQGNPSNGIVRYSREQAGYGNGSGYDEQIAADAWDNNKYMNIYIMQDLYADGATNNSGVAWYPDPQMSAAGLARVVYNGDYLGVNTNENFRSVFTHEFGHFLNLPHTFDGNTCSVHNAAFCGLTGDKTCDTPQMSSSILQDNALNCMGEKTNTENFMHYSDNYAMYTQDQVSRMTAALHSESRANLWSNVNLIMTGLEDYTHSADHPWDGSGVDLPPQGEALLTEEDLAAQKGQVQTFDATVPQGTQALVFYLDGYTQDPDLYVSKSQAPTKNGDNWEADFISFNASGQPEAITISAPQPGARYYASIDAYSDYDSARLQILAVDDPGLCDTCERVILLEEKDLAAKKGDADKSYQLAIPADATKVVAVMAGGYDGDPDMYVSMDSVPTPEQHDCGPFSAPRHSEYCELQGGGTLNIIIDPFLDYSEASLMVYYETGESTGPVANANGPYAAVVGDAVSFSSEGSQGVEFSWDFGDGNTSNQPNPSHRYASPGDYTARLSVVDANGNSRSDSAEVVISAASYCEVQGNTRYEWISKVALNEQQHTSDKDGYGDYSQVQFAASAGQNNLRLTSEGGYTEYWAVWVDANNNREFEASEKRLATRGKGEVTGDLDLSGLSGSVRMRIVMRYSSAPDSACGDIGEGEVEDYTLTIE